MKEPETRIAVKRGGVKSEEIDYCCVNSQTPRHYKVDMTLLSLRYEIGLK